MNKDKKYMKVNLTSKQQIEEMLDKILYPVEQFCIEKQELNILDDWNELSHNKERLLQIANEMENGKKYELYVYYIEQDEKVIAVVFFLHEHEAIKKILEKCNIPEKENVNCMQLTCFHILRAYRGGLGLTWLKEYIFPDIMHMGIKTIYVKSSHRKALSFYERLGTKIGNYIGVSDTGQYQRVGNIYKIEL